MLIPGTKAPEIALPDQHGRPFSLNALRGSKNVVLFFYPNDNGLVCTKEACAFRDAYEEFRSADTEVVGISVQDGASHRAFAERHRLPFILLTDAEETAREAYHVGRFLGVLRHRVTYVIDKEGTVRAAIKDMLDGTRHVREALGAIRALGK
jgi:peroxiredoxin Q/BCP